VTMAAPKSVRSMSKEGTPSRPGSAVRIAMDGGSAGGPPASKPGPGGRMQSVMLPAIAEDEAPSGSKGSLARKGTFKK
jgi:hypothetical protein